MCKLLALLGSPLAAEKKDFDVSLGLLGSSHYSAFMVLLTPTLDLRRSWWVLWNCRSFENNASNEETSLPKHDLVSISIESPTIPIDLVALGSNHS